MGETARNANVLIQLLQSETEVSPAHCRRLWARALKQSDSKLLEALSHRCPQWAPWENLNLDQLPLHAAQVALKSTSVDLPTAAKAAFSTGNVDYIYALALRADCDEATMREVLKQTSKLDSTATTAFFLLRTGKVPREYIVATSVQLIDNWPDQGTLDSHNRSDALVQTLSAALSSHVGDDEELWCELVELRPLPPVLAAVLDSCPNPNPLLVDELARQIHRVGTWGSVERKVAHLVLARPTLTDSTLALVRSWDSEGRLAHIGESSELLKWHTLTQDSGAALCLSPSPLQLLRLAAQYPEVDATNLVVQALLDCEDRTEALQHACRLTPERQRRVATRLFQEGRTAVVLELMSEPDAAGSDLADELASRADARTWRDTLAREIAREGDLLQGPLRHLVHTRRYSESPVMAEMVPLPLLAESHLVGTTSVGLVAQLSHQQRDLFWELLPRWTGSLYQLMTVIDDAAPAYNNG